MRAKKAARLAGNAEAVRELKAIARYFATGRPAPLKDIYTQRKWLNFCGRMFREGESTVEAIRVVRELGRSADDRGTREVPDLVGALLPSDRGTIR